MSLTHLQQIHRTKGALDWKTAYIIPAYKSRSRYSANNYRPISLTNANIPIPCKLLEHIILILEKIDGFLHNRQREFRRGLSCEAQLCATVHDILPATNQDENVYSAVLEFTNVFDRVSHALFMEKLSKIETMVDKYIMRWTYNFLLNRFQCVILNRTSL